MAAVSRSALRWDLLGTGAPSPQWALEPASLAAGCAALSPPRPSAYAGMIAALARATAATAFWREHRELPYRPVTSYEVWNEANLASFWCPRPDPPAYGRLYAAARDASAPWTRGRPSSLEAWLRSA